MKARLIWLVSLTQQIEQEDEFVGGEDIIHVLVHRHAVLLARFFEAHFSRLLCLLRPEKRNAASDLDMSELVGKLLSNELTRHEIRHLALLVNASLIEPSAGPGCVPLRDQCDCDLLREESLGDIC